MLQVCCIIAQTDPCQYARGPIMYLLPYSYTPKSECHGSIISFLVIESMSNWVAVVIAPLYHEYFQSPVFMQH